VHDPLTTVERHGWYIDQIKNKYHKTVIAYVVCVSVSLISDKEIITVD
jgi:hypothetical protein